MKRNLLPLLLALLMMVPILHRTVQAQQVDQIRQAQPAWLLHPEMHAKWKAWRETMRQTRFPKETGCFTASYPNITWTETTCGTPPAVHTSASAADTHPNIVGGAGGDDTAQVTGVISSTVGFFPIVTGYTPPPLSNYSLQVNTNPFSTSVCSGSTNPSCRGWVQFVFDDTTSQLYLEYSLLDWGTTSCPSGFNHTYGSGAGTVCYENTPITSVPEQPYANLPYLQLTGEVSNYTNTAILATSDGYIYATQQVGLLGTDLANGWNSSEFNVFGDDNGHQVNFNSGATFIVQENLNNGTTNVPYCENLTYTGETNNLNLIGSCCSYGGASPNIQFMESNNSVASSSCGANGIGGNITSPAPTDSGTYTIYGEEYPTITFTMTLYDTAPGAQIYWQVAGCSGSTSGSNPVSSGGGFTLVYESEYDCNPSGTMYAVVPGFLPSQTVPIDFP